MRRRIRLARATETPSPEGPLYIVSTLGDLCDETCGPAPNGGAAPRVERKFLLFHEGLPSESIPQRLLRLGIRHESRLHLVALESPKQLADFLGRFLRALSGPDHEERIIGAWWEGETLFVISPEFRRLSIPLTALPGPLRKAPYAARAQFEIDAHGEFVQWPSLDLHMGWDQFRQAVDPQAQLRARQRSEDFNRRYGQAVRSLRESAGLRQGDVAGLDARTVRRIEQGATRATHRALSRLAAAHGLALDDYLKQVADRLTANGSPHPPRRAPRPRRRARGRAGSRRRSG